MKAVRAVSNKEDGQSMKQNDEKQLSGGAVSLPIFPSLPRFVSRL